MRERSSREHQGAAAESVGVSWAGVMGYQAIGLVQLARNGDQRDATEEGAARAQRGGKVRLRLAESGAETGHDGADIIGAQCKPPSWSVCDSQHGLSS